MLKKEFVINPEGNKNVLILAGIHGNELTPIYALIKLIKYGHINSIKNPYIKKITVINCVNQDAIESKSRGIREIDLNRMFDTQAIERQEKIRNEILYQITFNDVIIDLHSYGSKNINKEIVLINNCPQAPRYVEFCKLNNLHFALQNTYQNSLKKYVIDLNKIAFTIELNGTNKINVQSAYQGIYIIQTILDNIQAFDFNKYIKLEKYPENYALTDIAAEHSGLFIDNRIIDFEGNILEDFNIHKNIIFNTTHDFVNKGDYCVSVQPNIDYQ